MKIYIKEVDCCECCPGYKRISVSNFGCYREYGKEIKDGSIIQDWCPLEEIN